MNCKFKEHAQLPRLSRPHEKSKNAVFGKSSWEISHKKRKSLTSQGTMTNTTMNWNRCPTRDNANTTTSHKQMQKINITWYAKPTNCCWHYCSPPSPVAAMHVHQIPLAALPVRLTLPTHDSEHRTDSSKKKASPRPRVPSSSSQCFSGASKNSKGGPTRP